MYNRSLSMMKFLLVAVVIGPMFCCSSADSDFFLVGSDLTTCLGVSKLHTTHCNKNDYMELHCVLDEDDQLGIGYLKKIWVPRGCCPFYRKDYDVLDYRPCVADASACPNNVDQYFSNDVYKYPGCLQESTATRGRTQTPVDITEDRSIMNSMTTVGMNEIHLSSHNPWIFAGPICLGLLIVAVIMYALVFLRRSKNRQRHFNFRVNDPQIYSVSRGRNHNSLTTSTENCHLIDDIKIRLVPMENTDSKSYIPTFVSTWPKARALEREKAIFQLNPTFLAETDA